MATTSTIEPGLGDNWSNFGAIVFVSVLGPALILFLAAAPFVVTGMVPLLLDSTLCRYVDFCGDLSGGDWSSWLVDEHTLLYVIWVTLGTGFASFATLESAFNIFRRAAPVPVLVWHATLSFVLATWLPVDMLRSLLSAGWAGTALVSVHYYSSYRALPLFQPPEAAAGDAQEVSVVSREISDSTEFPGGPGARQRRALRIFALYAAAVFGLACYAFVKDMPMLFMICCGVTLYCGLMVLHGIMSSWNARTLTINCAGLDYLSRSLSWREIGRVWSGTDGYRHVVVIETPAATAQRMLQATTWVNRLFAKANVARAKAGTAAHSVLIDTRFLMGEASELVQAIEGRRPPGSQWIPAAEVS